MSHREPPASSSPTRRQMIILGIGAFAVAALPFARRRPRRLIRRAVPLMGTIADVAVVHRDARFAHGAIDAAFDALRWVERTMTRFDDRSDVGRANLHAATDGVAVTDETARVVEAALRWAEASEGAFDPCIGTAVALWDVAHRREPLHPSVTTRLAGRRLYRHADVHAEAGRSVIRFTDPDVALDLGGIGKGYGVDCAVDALRRWGITQALVNVGGDLHALGDAEHGEPWRIGIRAPDAPERIVDTLEASDQAVATSGDYLQYFTYRGRRYHHLLDPATAAPRLGGLRSVTVVAERCLTADAAATSAFLLPPERARQVLRARAPDARIVHRI